MVNSAAAMKKYGHPKTNETKHMILWDVPAHLEIGVLPNRLYCNRDMIGPLSKAFGLLISRELVDDIKTWDGCFNIRPMKGTMATPSLHSWGIAIDIDAAWNGFKKKPTMSKAVVACFKEAGFDWGGNWDTKDGMHFQLSVI